MVYWRIIDIDMEVTSLYDYTKRFTEPQLQFQSALEYPTDFWENYLSDISKGALKSFDIKCPALPDMFLAKQIANRFFSIYSTGCRR